MKSVTKSDKAKYIIAIILVVAALLMIIAAVTVDRVSPPDVVNDNPADDVVSEVSAERRENFFTVLVVGIDAASNSTDTIMLAAFDIENKKMNMMSIPRDTITNTTRKVKKINAAYISHHKDITALMDEVESVTGVYPDKYALVTVDSFSEIIDEIGGVEFDVPFNMIYNDPTQDLKINIKKGYQTLCGHDAMGLMRYRATYAEGDIGRIKMQQAFVGAVMDKMMTASTIPKIPEIAQIIFDNVETNLTLGNEVWIGKELVTMNREEDIFMTTLPGVAGSYDGLSYYFPNEEEVLSIVNEKFNPYMDPIEKLDLFKR